MIILDMDVRRIFRDGVLLPAAPREFEIALFLAGHGARTTTRNAMHDHFYSMDSEGGPDPKVFDVHIARLRKYLPAGTIETIWGRGWRWHAPVEFRD